VNDTTRIYKEKRAGISICRDKKVEETLPHCLASVHHFQKNLEGVGWYGRL